jgi:hypothetical protein
MGKHYGRRAQRFAGVGAITRWRLVGGGRIQGELGSCEKPGALRASAEKSTFTFDFYWSTSLCSM